MINLYGKNESPVNTLKLKCNFGITESVGYIVIWIFLTIITFGLASIFFPYFLNKMLFNKTEVVTLNGEVIGRLNCRFGLAQSIGNCILWAILILITAGIASFFYVFRVIKVVLNDTYIELY